MRFWVVCPALHMDVDFLPAEFQRQAFAVAEGFQRHAEDFGVETDDGVGLCGGQHEVVEAVDHCWLQFLNRHSGQAQLEPESSSEQWQCTGFRLPPE